MWKAHNYTLHKISIKLLKITHLVLLPSHPIKLTMTINCPPAFPAPEEV
uniref:Uncharacterized protein n=1 Tax=Romanomermis culicivorax TaxID=13658 RepID=A0A915KZ66_ROMCU